MDGSNVENIVTKVVALTQGWDDVISPDDSVLEIEKKMMQDLFFFVLDGSQNNVDIKVCWIKYC